MSQPPSVEDLILQPATCEQTREALLQRYDAKGPLTLQQHLERADVLGSLKYAAGRQKYWVLVRKDSSDGDFLSSVATIERAVIIQRPSSRKEAELDSDVYHLPTLDNAFSITHVYTPPDLRKRGYATKMMSLLHEKLRPRFQGTLLEGPNVAHHEIATTGILSFLYSGVGEFYSKCGSPGWHIQTSTETYWNTASVIEEDVDHFRNFSQTLITEQDFVDIGRKDADLLREYLEARSRQGLMPHQFAVLPTGDEFAWLVARSKFYGKILSDKPLPDYWGVRVVDDSTNPTENFAIWFFDYVKKELHFLRIRCRDADVFKVITRAAAIAAKAQGCERILAWNVDEGLLSACPQNNRVTQPRTKNLAAVAWYGKGDCPEWAMNEKYGWC